MMQRFTVPVTLTTVKLSFRFVSVLWAVYVPKLKTELTSVALVRHRTIPTTVINKV
jgi:hypothetical protein